jgi:hypothetical protein
VWIVGSRSSICVSMVVGGMSIASSERPPFIDHAEKSSVNGMFQKSKGMFGVPTRSKAWSVETVVFAICITDDPDRLRMLESTTEATCRSRSRKISVQCTDVRYVRNRIE